MSLESRTTWYHYKALKIEVLARSNPINSLCLNLLKKSTKKTAAS